MTEEIFDYTVDPIEAESRWNWKTLLAILLPSALAALLGIQSAMEKKPTPPPVASRYSGSADRLRVSQAPQWVSPGPNNTTPGSADRPRASQAPQWVGYGAHSTGAANNVAIGMDAEAWIGRSK